MHRRWVVVSLLLLLTATAGGGFASVTLRPSGKILVVQEGRGGSPGGAWIVATDPTVATLTVLKQSLTADLRLDPTGRAVAYVCPVEESRRSLCIRSSQGTHLARLPLSGAWTWSPRGEVLAYSSGGVIRFAHADGSAGAKPVRVPTKVVQDLAWSRDDQLAFVARTGDRARLWTVRRDGSRLRALSASALSRGFPGIEHLTWSADGTKLAYQVQQHSAGITTWVLNLRSGFRVRLDGAVGARFAPVGDALMFQRWHGDRLDLYVRRGGRNRRLASSAWSPVWSPNGGWIAFRGGRGIEGVRIDGSSSTTLVARARLPGEGDVWLVDWVALH